MALRKVIQIFQESPDETREKMLIMVTDGFSYPPPQNPCEYNNPELYNLRQLQTTIIGISVVSSGALFTCSLTWNGEQIPFADYVFEISDFGGLSNDTFLSQLGELTCSSYLSCILFFLFFGVCDVCMCGNTTCVCVFFQNFCVCLYGCVLYKTTDEIDLVINEVFIQRSIRFVEIYNRGVGVTLAGFLFEGLFNGRIQETGVNINRG